MKTKPTAGAIRAARRLNKFMPGVKDDAAIEQVAGIIDQETGAPDLLDASRKMLACLEQLTTTQFGEGGDGPERELMEAAVAKAEGKPS